MSVADEVVRANAATAPTFHLGLAAVPSRHVAVVTCMDARLDVSAMLGLGPGEAHVLRNAGGIVTDDVVRSLAISQRRLGTREVVLVQHSGCGLLGFTDEQFAAELAADAGSPPKWRAGAFTDVEAAVGSSLRALRESPYLPHREGIRGFVLDVQSGLLTEVR